MATIQVVGHVLYSVLLQPYVQRSRQTLRARVCRLPVLQVHQARDGRYESRSAAKAGFTALNRTAVYVDIASTRHARWSIHVSSLFRRRHTSIPLRNTTMRAPRNRNGRATGSRCICVTITMVRVSTASCLHSPCHKADFFPFGGTISDLDEESLCHSSGSQPAPTSYLANASICLSFAWPHCLRVIVEMPSAPVAPGVKITYVLVYGGVS